VNNWYISDTHFSHANIIRYCNRPFKNVEEMDAKIISNWNSRVKKDDIIFDLGDWNFHNSPGGKKGEGTIKKAIDYDKQLNGKIIHIKGNHTVNNGCKTIIENIVIRYGGKRVFLVHKPEHVNFNYDINFCGHVHCLDEKTEILTENGWKNHTNITKSDLVVSLNKLTKNLELNNINYIKIEKTEQPIITLESRSTNFGISEKHRLYIRKHNSKGFKESISKGLLDKKNTIYYYYNSGNINYNGLNITDDEIQLIVWIAADGSISYDGKTPFIRFKLSKQRKIDRLILLLNKLNIKYTINKCKIESQQILIPYRINLLKSKELTKFIEIFKDGKRLPEFLRKVSKHQAKILLEEYSHTDGIKYLGKHIYIQISTSKKIESDLLQEICVLNGHKCSISAKKLTKNSNRKQNYILTILLDKQFTTFNTDNLVKREYQGILWCVNVPLDTIVTRRNGKVIIMCNSAWQIKRIRKGNLHTDAINISCDVWDFMPVTFEQILRRYNKWLKENKWEY